MSERDPDEIIASFERLTAGAPRPDLRRPKHDRAWAWLAAAAAALFLMAIAGVALVYRPDDAAPGATSIVDGLPDLPTHVDLPAYPAAVLFGRLELIGGCLRVQPYGDAVDADLVVWPDGWHLTSASNGVLLTDEGGAEIAAIGEPVSVSGGEFDPASSSDLVNPIPVDCPGPYWLAGSAASALGDPQRTPWEADLASLPTSESASLAVVFTEIACAGGLTPEGRIPKPEIAYDDDSITITLSVRAFSGPSTCQGNTPYSMTVELAEPIGDRTLVDGTTGAVAWDPRDPASAPTSPPIRPLINPATPTPAPSATPVTPDLPTSAPTTTVAVPAWIPPQVGSLDDCSKKTVRVRMDPDGRPWYEETATGRRIETLEFEGGQVTYGASTTVSSTFGGEVHEGDIIGISCVWEADDVVWVGGSHEAWRPWGELGDDAAVVARELLRSVRGHEGGPPAAASITSARHESVGGATLRALDNEMIDIGEGQWSATHPEFYLGDLRTQPDSIPAATVIGVDGSTWVLIKTSESTWYARNLRSFDTPDGRTVSLLDEELHVWDDCSDLVMPVITYGPFEPSAQFGTDFEGGLAYAQIDDADLEGWTRFVGDFRDPACQAHPIMGPVIELLLAEDR